MDDCWLQAFVAATDKQSLESSYKSNLEHGRKHISLRIAQHATKDVGCQVWYASRVLCSYLEHREVHGPEPPLFHGQRILELGAGCGLVGILGAHLGGAVTLTDIEDVLPRARQNVDLNPLGQYEAGALEVEELCWGTDIRQDFGRGNFDVIIGCDIIYADHLHGSLITTLLQLVSDKTEVIFAHARRKPNDIELWRKRFQRYFDVELVASEAEVLAYSKLAAGISTAKSAVSIFRLRLHGPPPFDDDLTDLLRGASPDLLLTRLALLDSDMESIEVVEDSTFLE